MYKYLFFFCLATAFVSNGMEDTSESETAGSDIWLHEKIACIMPKCGKFFTSKYLLQQHEKKHINALLEEGVAGDKKDISVKMCIAFECAVAGCKTICKSSREMLEHGIEKHLNAEKKDDLEIELRVSQKRPRSLSLSSDQMSSPIPQKCPKSVWQFASDETEEECSDAYSCCDDNDEFPETP